MREVNYLSDVVYGIAYLLGIDPTQDLNKDHARAWADSINSKVRYGWEFWEWPEFMVTEERALRQVYSTDVQYTAGQGDNSEFYYATNETYYRTIGAPPIGTLPTDDTYFEEIATDELDRHFAYEQNGKQDIGQVYAVYDTSPRLNTPAIQWFPLPSGYGLDVPIYTGTTVWITYKPRPPKFTTFTYDATVSYNRGDVVLDLDSGDCYISLVDSNGNNALNLAAYWLRQEFPYILSEYVKYAVAGDQEDDVQQKAVCLAQAKDALEFEVNKIAEQGQRHSYGPSRYPVRWPLGTTGFFWSINPPLST